MKTLSITDSYLSVTLKLMLNRSQLHAKAYNRGVTS
ncbi:hypothetical protein ALO78_200287 [Pseudomonas amygdali pv. ciccaronei]|nr:hypothetical protein ALO78_200287 [Pseudomonas amygdali pv. ciccaronei]